MSIDMRIYIVLDFGDHYNGFKGCITVKWCNFLILSDCSTYLATLSTQSLFPHRRWLFNLIVLKFCKGTISHPCTVTILVKYSFVKNTLITRSVMNIIIYNKYMKQVL